jgi:putative FmdB family regulatory protein
MPTYEYRCQKCGSKIEVFQSMLDEPMKSMNCPLCQKRRRVERVIGAGAGIIFKGSGFYETDYRSKEYREKAKKESESISPASKNSGSKSSGSKDSKGSSSTSKSSKSAGT